MDEEDQFLNRLVELALMKGFDVFFVGSENGKEEGDDSVKAVQKIANKIEVTLPPPFQKK